MCLFKLGWNGYTVYCNTLMINVNIHIYTYLVSTKPNNVLNKHFQQLQNKKNVTWSLQLVLSEFCTYYILCIVCLLSPGGKEFATCHLSCDLRHSCHQNCNCVWGAYNQSLTCQISHTSLYFWRRISKTLQISALKRSRQRKWMKVLPRLTDSLIQRAFYICLPVFHSLT